MTYNDNTMIDNEQQLRQRAIKSIIAKRAFRLHAFIYIIFTIAFLLGDYLDAVPGIQWAYWPIFGWGLGVLFNWYAVYQMGMRGTSETEIAEEIRRMQ